MSFPFVRNHQAKEGNQFIADDFWASFICQNRLTTGMFKLISPFVYFQGCFHVWEGTQL